MAEAIKKKKQAEEAEAEAAKKDEQAKVAEIAMEKSSKAKEAMAAAKKHAAEAKKLADEFDEAKKLATKSKELARKCVEEVNSASANAKVIEDLLSIHDDDCFEDDLSLASKAFGDSEPTMPDWEQKFVQLVTSHSRYKETEVNLVLNYAEHAKPYDFVKDCIGSDKTTFTSDFEFREWFEATSEAIKSTLRKCKETETPGMQTQALMKCPPSSSHRPHTRSHLKPQPFAPHRCELAVIPRTSTQPKVGQKKDKFLDINSIPAGSQNILLSGPWVNFWCQDCGRKLAPRTIHDHWSKAHGDQNHMDALQNVCVHHMNHHLSVASEDILKSKKHAALGDSQSPKPAKLQRVDDAIPLITHLKREGTAAKNPFYKMVDADKEKDNRTRDHWFKVLGDMKKISGPQSQQAVRSINAWFST